MVGCLPRLWWWFGLHAWQADAPRPGTELSLQQWPEPPQRQHQILNPQHHQGTPRLFLISSFFTVWWVGSFAIEFRDVASGYFTNIPRAHELSVTALPTTSTWSGWHFLWKVFFFFWTCIWLFCRYILYFDFGKCIFISHKFYRFHFSCLKNEDIFSR